MEKYIRCPACGCEYTTGEIFLPKHFVGQHKNVSRDYTGRIVELYGGVDQNLTEVYTCDKCGITFSVEADINYKTEQLSKKEATAYKQKL